MDIKRIIEALHPFEREILPFLRDNFDLDEILRVSGMNSTKARRAVEWLGNKGIINISKSAAKLIKLGKNGESYLKNGLPERRFLNLLSSGKFVSLSEISKELNLSNEETNISLGMLKSKAAVELKKGKELLVKITTQGKKLLKGESLEEKFLKKEFPIYLDSLNAEEKFAFTNLKKRKGIVVEELKKAVQVELTSLGKKIDLKKLSSENVIDKITSVIVKNYKKQKFRRYDIKINVPHITYGKRHFVNQAIEYGRKIWLEMGFEEMEGPMINTSFWNFDALFTAQDHPVRELQDTFFIKDPKYGKILDKSVMNKIKQVHENGGDTGSTGWQYKWQEDNARLNVMRTHTTVLSSRTIAKLKKSDWPAKFFAFGKCFRNETVDWSHLFEFNQTEGIVVDPDANFKHLLGYLREFFKKMGFPKARFRPAYFPYTEPSLEIDVFHPIRQEWIELGGAGIFRPEVTKSLLGEEVPVLAWGPGFDRILMDYYHVSDMRKLYKNNIKLLREIKEFVRF